MSISNYPKTMKFSPEARPYLDGDKFSNGFVFDFSPKQIPVQSRIDFLENISRDKKIIHIGFADHLPIIKTKIEKNEWLHKRLVDVSNLCVGIDINLESVEYVRSNFNIQNLHALDLIKDDVPLDIRQDFDFMILGEVLEHIDNPVAFLKSIKEKYSPYVSKLIITVPNAFNIQNVPFIFRSKEFVNTDHRFWFTPYTLAKVGHEAGLMVDEFQMCQTYMADKWWKNLLLKRYPLFRENLVMQFSL